MTTWYGALVFSISAVLVIWMIQKLGDGVLLRESIAFFYIFTCLIMPWIGYEYYSSSNTLSRIWVGYMMVPEANYYAFNLPAVSMFTLAITWPLANSADTGSRIRWSIQKIRDELTKNYHYGIIILCVGFVVSVITPFLPAGLQFFLIFSILQVLPGLCTSIFCPPFRYKVPLS